MSDLSNGCGCGNGTSAYSTNNCGVLGGNNSCLWIILLLIFCGGCGNSCGCSGTSTNSLFGGGSSCEWIIILLLCCSCLGNNGCGC
ncbi:MAG: chorion class high-cysteine HCB protein 13 [Lachnospiraceae bacterium]|nr:chorion class high-cysteine HCB protein 13 [Lachnospiraceae bacterium]